jgi:hypothetical protein
MQRLLIIQLLAAVGLIVTGAVVGVVGSKIGDDTVAAAMASAVIGAGATMVPAGAGRGGQRDT